MGRTEVIDVTQAKTNSHPQRLFFVFTGLLWLKDRLEIL